MTGFVPPTPLAFSPSDKGLKSPLRGWRWGRNTFNVRLPRILLAHCVIVTRRAITTPYSNIIPLPGQGSFTFPSLPMIEHQTEGGEL